MKILVIAFSKIKYAPYINFYLDNIDREKNEVHLLYWNRDEKPEDTRHLTNITLHEFRCYQEDDVAKTKKILNFWKFRQYTKQLLRKERFDVLFVLTSLPAVLLHDVLLKKYSNRYVFDYRDSTYERFGWFQKRIHDLVRNSYVSFVSSDAFREYFPKDAADKTYTSHNILLDSLEHRDVSPSQRTIGSRIRLAFWGFIRNEQLNQRLIEAVSKDQRFELHYYGREQQVGQNLRKYGEALKAENVYFHGEYRPEERYEFVQKTDLIHNLFDDGNMMRAMSNKYYDSAIFRLPQLCMPNSFMGRQCEESGIGLQVNPFEPGFLDKVYAYYTALDQGVFHCACDTEVDRVVREYEAGCQIIQQATGGA